MSRVLLFSTTGTAESAARLHAPGCQCVVAARGSRSRIRVIEEHVDANVADLKERGWTVKACKCLRAAESDKPRTI